MDNASSVYEAHIDLLEEGLLQGWAIDASDPERKLVLEILVDGISAGLVRADGYVEKLVSRGIGDGCFGFFLDLHERFRPSVVEALVANENICIATWRQPQNSKSTERLKLSFGEVAWRGGLRISGWLRDSGGPNGAEQDLKFFEGGEPIEALVRFSPGPSDLDIRARQFDALLPHKFADGEVHSIRVTHAHGVELQGSPVTVFAPAGGYSQWLEQKTGNSVEPVAGFQFELLDKLVPAAIPFEAYRLWARQYPPEVPKIDAPQAMNVLILGEAAAEATIASLNAQKGDVSIRVATVDTAADSPGRYNASDLLAAIHSLGDDTGRPTLVLRSGTVLAPEACAMTLSALQFSPDCGLLVSDYELFNANGTRTPLFWPAFDYERALAQGYCEALFVVRSLQRISLPLDRLISSYDLFFAALESLPDTKRSVAHLPVIMGLVPQLNPRSAANLLAHAVQDHLVRLGDRGTELAMGPSSLFPHIHVKRPPIEGAITIIIPTRDRLDLLKPCITTIRERTDDCDYRLLIIDNGSSDADTLGFLEELRSDGIDIIKDPRPFNYAQMHNAAVRQIATPLICFLNNDIEVVSSSWLTELRRGLARSDVGAVGAKLVWPNGMLQHGGVVLGTGFAASHGYDRYLANEPGYADGILIQRECSAVTAACLLMRRDDFMNVGGFDEAAFPVAFNDVDLCLKLRAIEKTVIWTPWATLLHRESASRRQDDESPAKRSRADKELNALRARWGHELLNDPYYNPNLNLDAYTYTALASPPRSRRLRSIAVTALSDRSAGSADLPVPARGKNLT